MLEFVFGKVCVLNLRYSGTDLLKTSLDRAFKRGKAKLMGTEILSRHGSRKEGPLTQLRLKSSGFPMRLVLEEVSGHFSPKHLDKRRLALHRNPNSFNSPVAIATSTSGSEWSHFSKHLDKRRLALHRNTNSFNSPVAMYPYQ
ncbi:hypothetical protein CDAR_17601 [Caerostris darwini]|uniref:Uncharacterized protein n=1 Tax=Caerostris darwini TaxID=1538125 RepID=A0AAV4NBW3_9ARAC|nr:hypothetical protein CDAR_17601 [Caerostris darwini]